MNSASRAAITAVARRISTSDGAAKIAAMTDAQLVNFIKETSVLNEKIPMSATWPTYALSSTKTCLKSI